MENSRVIMYFIYSLLGLLATALSWGQIVNIEDRIAQVGEGYDWNTEFSLSFRKESGNSEIESTAVSIHSVKREMDHSVWLLLGEYNYGESQGNSNKDNAKFHIRRVIPIQDSMNVEFFIQQQRNLFRLLTSRKLVGINWRWEDFLSPELDFSSTIGCGLFASKERYRLDEEVIEDEDPRGNLYLTSSFTIDSRSSWAMTWYFQPKLESFQDFYASGVSELSFAITEQLGLKVSLSVTHDSHPADLELEKTDISVVTALKFQF